MCVPYSFAITASGEIFDGKNLDHHTDICAKHGLEYDRVLKPEYQIWDRKLKDMEPTLDYFATGKRIAFSKDGMLREKFYRIAENHINKKFPDWKAGLEYFEENWDIVRKYTPDLTPRKGIILGGSYKDTRDKFFDAVANDEKRFIKIQRYDKHLSLIYDLHFFLREWGSGMAPVLARRFEIAKTEIMMYKPIIKTVASVTGSVLDTIPIHQYAVENVLEQRLKYEVRNLVREVCTRVAVGGIVLHSVLTFSDFAKHWSKEENRVPCWKN